MSGIAEVLLTLGYKVSGSTSRAMRQPTGWRNLALPSPKATPLITSRRRRGRHLDGGIAEQSRSRRGAGEARPGRAARRHVG